MINDIKINLHAKTGRIIRGNINYTLIHKTKYFFFKLNILEIRYSLVTIYNDLLDSPKKKYMLDRKKTHLYITAR